MVPLVYLCCHPADKVAKRELLKHLKVLERSGVLVLSNEVPLGQDAAVYLRQEIKNADVMIVVLSPDWLDDKQLRSDVCSFSKDRPVLPVLYRECLWDQPSSPVTGRALLGPATPIYVSRNPDNEFVKVALELNQAVKTLSERPVRAVDQEEVCGTPPPETVQAATLSERPVRAVDQEEFCGTPPPETVQAATESTIGGSLGATTRGWLWLCGGVGVFVVLLSINRITPLVIVASHRQEQRSGLPLNSEGAIPGATVALRHQERLRSLRESLKEVAALASDHDEAQRNLDFILNNRIKCAEFDRRMEALSRVAIERNVSVSTLPSKCKQENYERVRQLLDMYLGARHRYLDLVKTFVDENLCTRRVPKSQRIPKEVLDEQAKELYQCSERLRSFLEAEIIEEGTAYETKGS